uniref:Uncharacterized protein n=1 Tax=Terrapene triunguis TaxID=2587831 RepID=A0A674IIS0_9SAUR
PGCWQGTEADSVTHYETIRNGGLIFAVVAFWGAADRSPTTPKAGVAWGLFSAPHHCAAWGCPVHGKGGEGASVLCVCHSLGAGRSC